MILVEPISKIVAKGPGQGVPRIENGAYTQYVSISIRGTTQPWTLRRFFEIGSKQYPTAAVAPIARLNIQDHYDKRRCYVQIETALFCSNPTNFLKIEQAPPDI